MTAAIPRPLPKAGHGRVAGKVVLVTGGGGGLGKATSLALAERGAAVVAADIRVEAAAAVAREASERNLIVAPESVDLLSAASIERCIAEAIARFGRLDVLINNAGVDVTVPVTDLSVSEWDTIVGVNLRGPFLASRLAFKHMAGRGGGHIVNIVSTASVRAWPNASAYHASKWGLLGLSHALHAEGRSQGIKVTAVISGGMRTPFLLDRFPEIDRSTLQDPAAVAETIAFVLSQPKETVIPEVMVLPTGETSWP